MTRILSLLIVLASAIPTRAEQTYDVVVYGGTSAGVTAAVQAARMGRSVVLIEPGEHLGGLTSGGLGWTDSGNKAVIGGLSRDFYRRVQRHYSQQQAWKHERPEQYARYRPHADAMWTFEPQVAEQIMERLVREAGVPVRRRQRLDRKSGVQKSGARIESIRMLNGDVYRGRMFIDATYEGDLMAAAGVKYTVGRESNSTYDETLNGVQKSQNTHNHRFLKAVDPYRTPGDPGSGLLPGVHDEPPGEEGQGDHRIQAYCYRMCLSRVPDNRVPFAKPDDYDPLRYELLLRNFEAGDLRLPMKNDMMPNGKTDTNNNCAFSTDNIGMNYDYPEATYERRQEILREHLSYQQGLMWTLANHPRVPEKIRREMSQWGLAADEFTETGHWPHQIYVREARRMVGEYVVTEHDCMRQRIVPDSVGLGSYNMDSHNVQRYVTPENTVQNEGDVQVSPGGAYLISYRAIVPRRGEADNLLVPVCLSASHIAYGSIRMEPVFMILGQSAATAAAQAIEADCAVQDVDYDSLRKRLLGDGQVLDLPPGSKPKKVLLASQLPGVVLDDDQAELEGVWVASSSAAGFVGRSYRHDNNVDKGANRARYRVRLEPGRYEVRVSYSPHANRATNVPLRVVHADGQAQHRLNQRRQPSHEVFQRLGVYRFDTSGEVVVETAGTDGHVIIDAVQFLPQK